MQPRVSLRASFDAEGREESAAIPIMLLLKMRFMEKENPLRGAILPRPRSRDCFVALKGSSQR